MRVTVTRSGGFAGLDRRAELDTADHPELARLIGDIRFDDVPEPTPSPDRFVYEVRIGDRSVRVGEADLRGPLRDLIDRVLTHGR